MVPNHLTPIHIVTIMHIIITFNLLAVDRSKKEVVLMCEILGWVITLHA